MNGVRGFDGSYGLREPLKSGKSKFRLTKSWAAHTSVIPMTEQINDRFIVLRCFIKL